MNKNKIARLGITRRMLTVLMLIAATVRERADHKPSGTHTRMPISIAVPVNDK